MLTSSVSSAIQSYAQTSGVQTSGVEAPRSPPPPPPSGGARPTGRESAQAEPTAANSLVLASSGADDIDDGTYGPPSARAQVDASEAARSRIA